MLARISKYAEPGLLPFLVSVGWRGVTTVLRRTVFQWPHTTFQSTCSAFMCMTQCTCSEQMLASSLRLTAEVFAGASWSG